MSTNLKVHQISHQNAAIFYGAVRCGKNVLIYWSLKVINFNVVFAHDRNDSFFFRWCCRLVKRDSHLATVQLQLFTKFRTQESKHCGNLQRFDIQRMTVRLFRLAKLLARIITLFHDSETLRKKTAACLLIRHFRRQLVRFRTFRLRACQPDWMNAPSIETLDLFLNQIAGSGISVSTSEWSDRRRTVRARWLFACGPVAVESRHRLYCRLAVFWSHDFPRLRRREVVPAVRRRRVVGHVIVKLSADRRAVAISWLSHFTIDDVLVAVEHLGRTAHGNCAWACLSRWRLVTRKVAVAAHGTGQADVGGLSARARSATVAWIEAVVVAVAVVVIVVDSEAIVASEVDVVEVVEVPLVDESSFSRHSEKVLEANSPQKCLISTTTFIGIEQNLKQTKKNNLFRPYFGPEGRCVHFLPLFNRIILFLSSLWYSNINCLWSKPWTSQPPLDKESCVNLKSFWFLTNEINLVGSRNLVPRSNNSMAFSFRPLPQTR